MVSDCLLKLHATGGQINLIQGIHDSDIISDGAFLVMVCRIVSDKAQLNRFALLLVKGSTLITPNKNVIGGKSVSRGYNAGLSLKARDHTGTC